MIFPVNQEQLSEAISNFIQSMRKGNFLYQEFGIDPCQPNLEVKEVVEKMRMLQHRIRITEDTGFFTAAELFQKLDYLLITSVLIVPPYERWKHRVNGQSRTWSTWSYYCYLLHK